MDSLAVTAIGYYRLAEKFGAGVGAWSIGRAQAMLVIMGEEAKLQEEQQKKQSKAR